MLAPDNKSITLCKYYYNGGCRCCYYYHTTIDVSLIIY